MDDVLVFIMKWFFVLPICIGTLIMPVYVLWKMFSALYKDWRDSLRPPRPPEQPRQ